MYVVRDDIFQNFNLHCFYLQIAANEKKAHENWVSFSNYKWEKCFKSYDMDMQKKKSLNTFIFKTRGSKISLLILCA